MAAITALPAVAPAAATADAASSPASLALEVGKIVDALVLRLIGDAGAQLAVGGKVIDVATTTPLTQGSALRLAVATDGKGGVRLVIQPQTPAGDTVALSGAARAAGSDATAAAGSRNPNAGAVSAQAGAAASAGGASTTAELSVAGAATTAGAASATPQTDSVAATLRPQAALPVVSEAVAARAALTASVGQAAATQGSQAAVFADAAAVLTHEALPASVQDAAARVLSLRPVLSEGVTGQDVAAGVSKSGIFLEARLAAVATAGETGARVTLPDDLKAALLSLRETLSSFLAAAQPAEGDAALPQAAAPNPPARPDVAATATSSSAAPVAPPYRGGAMAAQPIATAAISADDSAPEAARTLLADTDAALSRHTLLQAASLPDAQTARHAGEGPTWAFEIPFATRDGTAMAQFQISRDGSGGGQGERIDATWRARFSVTVEPIGPVHAQIALTGARTAVTLWAERPESAAALRDNTALLSEGFRAADLESGDVLVRDGSPPRPRAQAGTFLDRAS